MPVVKATDLVMVRSRASTRDRSAGFTLIDMLVSITIIGVLIGLMLPGLSRIRETTRRVVCSSNIRQHGLGIAMYADDYSGAMAPSRFLFQSTTHQGARNEESPPVYENNQSQQTVLARVGEIAGQWDGLGWLFAQEYLPAPGIYYCPSHHAKFSFRTEVSKWRQPSGELVTNYQYRGGDLRSVQGIENRAAIVTDAMRTVEEYNHEVGCNVLRRDLSVSWFHDGNRDLASNLAMSARQRDAGQRVDDAWDKLDQTGPRSGGQ